MLCWTLCFALLCRRTIRLRVQARHHSQCRRRLHQRRCRSLQGHPRVVGSLPRPTKHRVRGIGASRKHGKLGSMVHGEGRGRKALGVLACDAVTGATNGKMKALTAEAVEPLGMTELRGRQLLDKELGKKAERPKPTTDLRLQLFSLVFLNCYQALPLAVRLQQAR